MLIYNIFSIYIGLKLMIMAIKNINDYIDEVQQKFPQVSKADIKRILSYGWKSIYLHNMYGGDTLIKDDSINKYLFYIGRLTYDSIKHFYYYIKKLTVKLRVFSNRHKDWDGYYYFALSQKQYDYYLSQQKSRGRRRKHFKFGSVMLYKLLDECNIKEYNKEYFFRVPFIEDVGFTILDNDYKTDKAEFLFYRKKGGFDVILNKYEARSN